MCLRRQILAQQPNRNYSRSLTVTETHFRLVHYDRSGTYISPVFNIHKHHNIFIRYVLGLSSPDESILGFDTSVKWEIDSTTGRKISGTITVEEYVDADTTSIPLTYELDMNDPPLVRSSIRGRGTVGWHALDPATKGRVLIKDAWRTSSRESECDLLKAARNIRGVVDMLSFQDRCAQTSDYRSPGFRAKDFSNRIKLRIVMKRYGPSVWYFKSRLQLLQALRDALIGKSLPHVIPTRI